MPILTTRSGKALLGTDKSAKFSCTHCNISVMVKAGWAHRYLPVERASNIAATWHMAISLHGRVQNTYFYVIAFSIFLPNIRNGKT